jgi:hypothetical protein
LGSSRNAGRIKFPSLCFGAGNLLALADEGTKTLRVVSTAGSVLRITGTPFDLGEVRRPSICRLNSGFSRIAVVDGNTQMLRALVYSTITTEWTQVGDSINVGEVNEPVIKYESADVINLYDAYTGTLQRYTFAAPTWSATGNPLTIGGGYHGCLAKMSSTVWGFVQSDSYRFFSSETRAYITMLNGINARHGIYLNPGYVLNQTGSGADFDIDSTLIGSMKTVKEIDYNSVAGVEHTQTYTLKKILELPEVFQNYWYVEFDPSPLGDYQIKFTQPDLFSSIGTDIVITDHTSSLSTVLNQREYKDKFLVDKEEITFNNEWNTDFIGELVDYGRNTPIIEKQAFKITTDFKYVRNNFLNLEFDLSDSDLFMIYGADDSFGDFIVEAGTGISSDTNVHNEVMSKARIQDSYWKDYRYTDRGTITINGSSSAVQDTCRDIIGFPDVQLNMDEFPTSIASLDWGSGIKSYITNLSLSLDTYITTIQSRLLDL